MRLFIGEKLSCLTSAVSTINFIKAGKTFNNIGTTQHFFTGNTFKIKLIFDELKQIVYLILIWIIKMQISNVYPL